MENDNKPKIDTSDINAYFNSIMGGEDFLQGKYSISFYVDDKSIVDVVMDWPENDSQTMAKSIAHLIFSLNKGDLKSLVYGALTESTIKRPELESFVFEVAKQISNFHDSNDSEPCIKPRDTLRPKS